MNQTKDHQDRHSSQPPANSPSKPKQESLSSTVGVPEKPVETGGFEDKVEPTRFGDWEIAGRCIDF